MQIIDKNFFNKQEYKISTIYDKKVILEMPTKKIDIESFQNIMDNSIINEDHIPNLNISNYISNYDRQESIRCLFRLAEYNGEIHIKDNGRITELDNLFERAKLKDVYIDRSIFERTVSMNNIFDKSIISGQVHIVENDKNTKNKNNKIKFPIEYMQSAFSGIVINNFISIIENIKPVNNIIIANYAFSNAKYYNSNPSKGHRTLDLSYMHAGDIQGLFLGFAHTLAFDFAYEKYTLTIDLHNIDLHDYHYEEDLFDVTNAFAVNVNYDHKYNGIIIFKLNKTWLEYPDKLRRAIGIGKLVNSYDIIEYDDYILLKMKPLY